MYRNNTDDELFQILDNQEDLTFSAKLNLKKELEKRSFFNEARKLNTPIEETNNAIKRFEFLGDLGYKVDWISENSFTINRSKKAKALDTTAIILGFVLAAIGARDLIFFIAKILTGQSIEIFGIVVTLAVVVIGIYGLTIMTKGFYRFNHLGGLRIFVEGNDIVLRKRKDLKFDESKIDSSAFNLTKEDKQFVLSIDELPIMTANSNNPIQRRSIEHLYSKLK